MNKQYHDFLNIIGLRCPEPLMIIRRTIRNMKKNDKILILSDDPTTKRDIPKFCFFMDYTLMSKDIDIKPYRYVIKK